jgi:parallel beta-helix repeat protein
VVQENILHTTGISPIGGNSIVLRNTTGTVAVSGNQITNSRRHALQIFNASAAVQVASNIISQSSGHGIYLRSVGGAVAVSLNNVEQSGAQGIRLETIGQSPTVELNTATLAGSHGIAVENVTGALAVTGNNVSGAGGLGINVAQVGQQVVLQQNTVSDSGSTGIGITDAGAVTITGNVVSASKGSGIAIRRPAGATLAANTATGSGGHGVDVLDSSTDVQITNQTSSASGGSGVSAENTTGSVTVQGSALTSSGREGTAGVRLATLGRVQNNQVNGAGTCGVLLLNYGSPQVNGNTFSNVYLANVCLAEPSLGTPTITSLNPTGGPAAGGTSVIITGDALGAASSITFGGVPVGSFVIDTPNQITAVAPPHDPGVTEVVVTTPGGSNSTISTANDYEYFGVPHITQLVPNAGPTSGGNTVSIRGQFLNGATQVLFGATPASSYTVVNAGEILAVAPAHAAGFVDVSVASPGGSSANTPADDYRFLDPPTVTDVTPRIVPSTGGTTVIITGANLISVSAVLFGATPAASFTVNSATQITAVTPAHAPGLVDVRVTTPGGTSANTVADDFTFFARPSVANVAPRYGPTAGGTTVTITGTDFVEVTGVSFGSTLAASFTVDSAPQITAVTPARVAGTVNVIVSAAGGDSPDTAADDFTYLNRPTVTNLTPSAGPTSGGNPVIITGTDFIAVSAVTFGATPAASFSVNSTTQITAVAPAHAAGTVDVTVTTPGGVSENTTADDYRFLDRPTITNLNPDRGPSTGGNTVVITGTNFVSVTAVNFGTTPAAGFTVVSPTHINAVAPAYVPGAVDVSVTTPGGTSENTAADDYRFFARPAVANLNPTYGPSSGGTSVVITGSDLSEASAVKFGETPAASYVVDSDTQITAVTPAHPAGVADVIVTTPGGDSENTNADNFTFVAAPTVANLNPNRGSTAGGNTVIITGSGFSFVLSVTFGGTPAASFFVNSPTQITATAPAHASGAVDIIVTTVGGASANTAADNYTYVPAPSVTSINPNAGPTNGGTSVVITGANLTGATAVTFGGTPASSFTVNSGTQVTAVSPARAAGAADILVTTVGGTSANTSADNFTYVAQPAISGINPNRGAVACGTAVVLTGTAIDYVTQVTFDGTAANFTVQSATQITAISPAHAAATTDVRVTSPGGASPNTSADDFTYLPPPSVSSLAPAGGPLAGGNTVTITGVSFSDVTSVTFGGTPASSITVINASTLNAVAPAHSAGTVDVRVITLGGTSPNTSADDYAYVAAPTVTAISPNMGPAAGGTTVVITGTNLTGATAVTFGGVAASSFTVNSASQITATSPAGSGGIADIRVTAVGGASANTSADDFTYRAAATRLAVVNRAGGAHRVYIYNTSGALLSNFNLNSGNTDARGITTVDGGQFWVVDRTDRLVYRYNTNGVLNNTFGLASANDNARGIATADGQTFYVVDASTDAVYIYNTSGSLLGSFNLASGNSSPEAIATDGLNICVANDSNRVVYRYSMTGALLGSFTLPSANNAPRGISTDLAAIWVADSKDDVIYRYNMSGAPQSNFSLASGNGAAEGVAGFTTQ